MLGSFACLAIGAALLGWAYPLAAPGELRPRSRKQMRWALCGTFVSFVASVALMLCQEALDASLVLWTLGFCLANLGAALVLGIWQSRKAPSQTGGREISATPRKAASVCLGLCLGLCVAMAWLFCATAFGVPTRAFGDSPGARVFLLAYALSVALCLRLSAQRAGRLLIGLTGTGTLGALLGTWMHAPAFALANPAVRCVNVLLGTVTLVCLVMTLMLGRRLRVRGDL